MKTILIILFALVTVNYSKDVECVLKHSASAKINDKNQIKTNTSDEDSIYVKIKNIGEDVAIFNDIYKLQILKRDKNTIYYRQDIAQGIVVWAYLYKTHSITYSKIREFPIGNLPDSYLMIGKCK